MSVTRPVDLVVWPEGMIQTSGPYQGSDEANEVSQEAIRLGATVLVGVEPTLPDGRYLNEAVAWGPDGSVVSVYVKNHLVPFGEYIPWRSFISRYFNVSAVPSDGVPGHSTGLMRTPAGPLGVMISYEVFFDERARWRCTGGRTAPGRADQHRFVSQQPGARRRAGRREAASLGNGQMAAPGHPDRLHRRGRAVGAGRATLPLGAEDVVEETVPCRDGWTVYVAIGDDAVALLALVALVAAWLSARTGSRHDYWTRSRR